MPFNYMLHIKMYENIARSRLFCRIAKRSVINLQIDALFVGLGALRVETIILKAQICIHPPIQRVDFLAKVTSRCALNLEVR